MLAAEEIAYHIRACALNSRESQKMIYRSFYSYTMAICCRYTNSQEDAVEILNEGFLKIFKEIKHFKPAYADVISSFKGWLRKIMIYTAIDRFRKNRKHLATIAHLDNIAYQVPSVHEDAVEKLTHKEIIRAIQDLSPAYQTVFNLFVIGGFSHDEIAEKLGISVGTSKSNVFRARKRVQKILFKQNNFSLEIGT